MDKPRSQKVYEFGQFRLDAAHLLLYQNGREISLTPKVVETLLALVERSGEVLSKDEMMEIVWANSFVEEGNLSQNLYILRKILSETADGRPLIETLKRRGYRFNGDVTCRETETPENSTVGANHSTAAQVTVKTPAVDAGNEDYQSRTSADSSAIVGRKKEIAELTNLLLRSDTRLITLIGVGGAGKTKLAQAVAGEMTAKFPDGVFFIELAAITNHELVAPTIAQQFGIKETGGTTILETLREHLRDKKMLIVADNFEQVIDGAPIIGNLLAAENVRFLVTSRILLRLRAEKEFVVPPLALPGEASKMSLAELSNCEAVKLFVERARNIKPNFALTEENSAATAEICTRLDGLPLAIELAAARIKILSPRAILAKLENRLRLLTGGASDLPARQQTMRGAIDWSYELLSKSEQRLFRHLAVFAGGFTFEAAETVCGGDESTAKRKLENDEQFEILDIITSLIDKSLLVLKERADDEQRFRMLEIVREYALDSLEQHGEAETLKCRHAEYFLRFAETAEPHLLGAESVKWLDRLEENHDNLRNALVWLLENEANTAARLAGAISYFWSSHSHLTEGRDWLETVLRECADISAETRFKLLNGLGVLARFQGDNETARNFYAQALTVGREADNLFQIATSSRGLGVVAYRQGDYRAARQFIEEGLAISRQLNDQTGIAPSLNILGDLARAEGDNHAARPFIEESLAICRRLGNKQGICANNINLGILNYTEGDLETAIFHFAENLSTARELGDKAFIAYSFDGFAALALSRGQLKIAARLAGAAQHLHELSGYEDEPAELRFRDLYHAKLTAALDKADFNELYEQGRELQLEKAAALCLE